MGSKKREIKTDCLKFIGWLDEAKLEIKLWYNNIEQQIMVEIPWKFFHCFGSPQKFYTAFS